MATELPTSMGIKQSSSLRLTMYVCMYTVVTAVLKAVSLSGGHTVATELPTSMGIKQSSSLRLTMYVWELVYSM